MEFAIKNFLNQKLCLCTFITFFNGGAQNLTKCKQGGEKMHKNFVGAICAMKMDMKRPNPQRLEYMQVN
jgi:hypothetical protein